MIIRSDYQWTTIQCKNLVGDNGKECDLCFKVLTGKFALIQRCPYCLGEIDLRKSLYKENWPGAQGALQPTKISCAEKGSIKKQFPKVRIEDTVGYQRGIEKAAASKKEDAGTLLWKESAEEHAKRHYIKED